MSNEEKDQNPEQSTVLVKQKKQEPTIEVVKDQYNHDRAVARAETGKFAKRHRNAVLKNMRDVISLIAASSGC